jgi:hypothetical protein
MCACACADCTLLLLARLLLLLLVVVQWDAEVRDRALGLVEDFGRGLPMPAYKEAYESLLVSEGCSVTLFLCVSVRVSLHTFCGAGFRKETCACHSGCRGAS